MCPGGSARSGVDIDVGVSRCNPMLTGIRGDLLSSQEAVTNWEDPRYELILWNHGWYDLGS